MQRCSKPAAKPSGGRLTTTPSPRRGQGWCKRELDHGQQKEGEGGVIPQEAKPLVLEGSLVHKGLVHVRNPESMRRLEKEFKCARNLKTKHGQMPLG